MMKEWRTDSLGCNGLRAKIHVSLKDSMLIGLDKACILGLLGKPNRSDEKSFEYYIHDWPCDREDHEIYHMVITFDLANKVKDEDYIIS